MSEEAAFLRAIAENPKDDTARLAFADWLQERDDPRAPWIRDAEVWEAMKVDGKDPTQKLLALVRRRQWRAGHLLGKMGPAVVPVLLNALPELKERASWSVMHALEQIGPSAEPVLPLLLRTARLPEKRMRFAALRCLAGLTKSHEDALRAAIEGLDDEEQDVRQTALAAVHNAGPAAIVAAPRLTEIVRRREKGMVWASLFILAEVGALDESLIPDLLAILATDEGNAAAAALSKLGPAAARPILEAAGGFAPNTVWRAAEALERTGPDVVPILREALSSPTPATRQLAAQVLAKLSAADAEAVPGIIEALRSPNATLRSRALEAVNRLGPAAADALPALLELLEAASHGSHEGYVAAFTIGRLGPAAESAVPAMLGMLTRNHGLLAPGLVNSLAQLGRGPSAIVLLLNASRSIPADRYDWVSQALWNSNLSQGHDDLRGLREVVRAYRERTGASTLIEPARLAAVKSPKVKEIRAHLSDSATTTRLVAVWALRHVATPEAAAAIVPALKGKDKVVRGAAARALGRVGNGVEGVVEALAAALKDRARDVRDAAEAALERLKPTV